MLSYFSALLEHARQRPDHVAVCDDSRTLSYRELVERAESAAAALVAAGIGPESRVGLTIADELENIIATLALLRAGAWQLTLATHDSADVRGVLAGRIHATHVLAQAGFVPLPGVPTVAWQLPAAESLEPGSAEGGMYFRTSGTTGDSNLVPFSGGDIALQAARNPEYAVGRHLRLASVEHNNSKRHRLYCLYMGATNVLRPDGAFDVAAYCRRQRVTCVDMSIMHAVDLANRSAAPSLSEVDIRVGGSATPFEVRRRLEERVSPRLFVRYGSTETGTIAICQPGAHDAEESVGHPVAGITLEIVDDAGQPRPTNEIGQIRMRGEGIAMGYFEGPEQTARRFRGGWFWPGDVGYLRADGTLVVKGRTDEMILLNGINIFPSELEQVLEEYPGVRLAAATAIKSPVHGDIPVAAVELEDGSEVTPMVLMKYARQRLALRAPRRIVVLAELPRNSQGKLLRREIARIIDLARKES